MIVLFLAGCGDDRLPKSDDPDVQPTADAPEPLVIAFLAPEPPSPTSQGWLSAAKVAAKEVSKNGDLGRPLVISAKPLSGPALAGSTDDAEVIGAITVKGFDSLAAATDAVNLTDFPVFELSDDLYEAGALLSPVFQVSPPHSWQAFRLARYFGPGDRAYKKVGLLREPGSREGEVAAEVLGEALANRKLQFIDAPGEVQPGIAQLAEGRPQAVVIEGDSEFRRAAAGALAAPERRYETRARIANDWRPQPAFFSSQLGDESPVVGTVASGDYAFRFPGADVVESAKKFKNAMSAENGDQPSGYEVGAYDSVRILAEAYRRGITDGKPPDRARVLEELERFDRVRFGHLPVSLGPDDHVVAERDVLGLWASGGPDTKQGWQHIMRTFTSDLERTNVLEEDWASFFPGADPKGEAPFYHQSKVGIVSKPDDNLN